MSLFDKFKTGLNLSSLNFSKGIKDIFSKKNIEGSILSRFEELLISADVGVECAAELKKEFEKLKIDKNLTNSSQIIDILISKVVDLDGVKAILDAPPAEGDIKYIVCP